MTQTLRIATRKSKMALTQTQHVANLIEKANPGVKCELVGIVTDGDYEKFKGDLKTIGGKGAFVKGLEVAILNGDADLAVHSMKDVPTDEDLPEGLTIAAALKRDDIRDVAVCRDNESFEELPEGAKVGTCSVRRAAQIATNFAYLTVVPLRGNVDTRLQKLEDGEVDCALLAKSGLERLNLQSRISTVFEPDMMLPALAQGTVGVECRSDNTELLDMLSKINVKDSYTCLMVERHLLQHLGGNCHTPVGGYCEVTKGGNLRLIAAVYSPDGKTTVRTRMKMPYNDWAELAKAAADDLKSQGAEQIIAQASQAA